MRDKERDKERIAPLCEYLATVWKTYFPDWRFMQLITNIQIFMKNDGFYTEDDDFYSIVQKFVDAYMNEGAVYGN